MLTMAVALCALTASAQQVSSALSAVAPAKVDHLPAFEESWIVPFGGTIPAYNSKSQYFYDNENRLVRVAEYAVKTIGKGDDMYLNKYYYYEYDDQGHLAVTFSRQGNWDDQTDEFYFMTPKDSVRYTYNDQGLQTEKLERFFRTTYEYDAEGHLTKESKFMRSNNLCTQAISYGGYVAPGCPTTITSESDNVEYLRYKATFTYNEAHQPVLYERYKETMVDGGEGGETQVVKTVTERNVWGYDEATGRKLYEVVAARIFEGGDLMLTDSTAYDVVDGDANRIKVTHYDNTDGQWSGNGAYSITTYQDFNTNNAVSLSAALVDGSVNDYQISFRIPDAALMGGYQYHIYRDGSEIKQADFTEEGAVDPTTQVYTYVDQDVAFGAHDYFVQTVQVEEMGEKVADLNVSNIVKVSHETELPTVRNIHYGTYRRSTTYGYLVKVTWDAPEEAEKYKLQRYNVLIDDSEWADNYNTDGQETEWEVPLETRTSRCSVVIESVYPYGSSRTGVNVSMKDVLASIDQSVVDGVHSIYTHGVLHFSAPTEVKVYDVAGKCVKTASQASEVSLEGLPTGTYAVLVEHQGEVSVMKVVK